MAEAQQAARPPANGDIEVVDSSPPPEPKQEGFGPNMDVVYVGMDRVTGGIQIEKDETRVPTWEKTIAILSTALEVAKFHRNLGHGAVMQARAMQAAEEQHMKAALARKGKLHV